MKTYLVISAISIILLSGCGSVEPKPEVNKIESEKIPTQQKKIKKVSTPIVQKSYLPNWIMNANSKKGYMRNIGSSVLNPNMAITKKVATIQAKANISQDIRSYIDTQVELQENCKNDECKSKFSSRTKITSTQTIRNIEIKNHFTDTKQKIYYIQVCSKI
jgi:hypothetical protein